MFDWRVEDCSRPCPIPDDRLDAFFEQILPAQYEIAVGKLESGLEGVMAARFIPTPSAGFVCTVRCYRCQWVVVGANDFVGVI